MRMSESEHKALQGMKAPQYLELTIFENANGDIAVTIEDFTRRHDSEVMLAMVQGLGVKMKKTCDSPCG